MVAAWQVWLVVAGVVVVTATTADCIAMATAMVILVLLWAGHRDWVDSAVVVPGIVAFLTTGQAQIIVCPTLAFLICKSHPVQFHNVVSWGTRLAGWLL